MNDPELYSVSNRCSIEACSRLIDKYDYLLRWKNKPSILELGSADGGTTEKVLIPILPEDLKVLMLSDVSWEMLDCAKKRKSLQNFTVRRLDIMANKLPSDLLLRFDHVVSFYLFHWVKDTDQAFKNIFELLSPGGELFSICFSQTTVDEAFENMSLHPKWAKYRTDKWISPFYKHENVVEAYKRKLEDNGFVDVVVQPEVYTNQFTSETECKELITSVNPSVSEVPPQELFDFLSDYLNYYKRSNCVSVEVGSNGEEIIKSHHRLLVLHARKPISGG